MTTASDTRADIDVAGLTRDDAAELLAVDQWAFGFDRSDLLPDDERVVVESLEWDRTYGARRRAPDRLAGIYSVVSGQVTVPGGRSVPASGLTWVGVHPRDRRRGVLTALMTHHLADVAARGEPLSLLYAAEGTIYGRFGYGTAARALALTLPRSVELREVPGADRLVADLEIADLERHGPRLAECFERARRTRPGWLSRERRELLAEAFLDPRRRRRGAESLRLLTVSDPDGELRGYALFRRKMNWTDFSPTGTVSVSEAVALDGAAARALWSRLTDLDLTDKIETSLLATDDPLAQLLADPRAGRPAQTDGLWARVVDVPAALRQRGYAADVDVVLGITDSRLPANTGRWHVVGGPDGATCTATERAADLELDVRELGAAYFGGTTLAALVNAGLARAADAATLQRASVAFSSPVAPHCGWTF